MIRANGVVVDRAKGSVHPRFPALRCPVDYGHVPGTVPGLGRDLGVFVGSAPDRALVGRIVNQAAASKDDEVKLLWSLTEEEVAAVAEFVNQGDVTNYVVERVRPSATTPTPSVTLKVFAYITHRRRLLIFRHPESPAAGVQVPGGTVKAGEDPAAAVLREGREETGLADLAVVGFLGEATRAMADFSLDYGPNAVHHRFFFHLRCGGHPPETWRHYERFGRGGRAGPIAFEFCWVALPDARPDLIADQDLFIPQLLARLDDSHG